MGPGDRIVFTNVPAKTTPIVDRKQANAFAPRDFTEANVRNPVQKIVGVKEKIEKKIGENWKFFFLKEKIA